MRKYLPTVISLRHIRVALFTFVSWLGVFAAPCQASGEDPDSARQVSRMLHQLALQICAGEEESLPAIFDSLGGAGSWTSTPLLVAERTIGNRFDLSLDGQMDLTVERVAPDGNLRRLTVILARQMPVGVWPLMIALLDADCTVRHVRRLGYDADGRPSHIDVLDADFETVLEVLLLNPPVPVGVDPGGIPIGLVDSGVNYLLPSIASRLARDLQGELLGRDFWDQDARPFDANAARSQFFPQRHGTRTAHILLGEAPVAKLVPYRYPRPDMSRMRALIEDAASKGVRIMNLSLGSNKREDWSDFADAARTHPDMLFVISAGNNGRDIDQYPVFPAALDIDNAITVTSAEEDGRLAPGSNWGKLRVDLAVPGENMLTTGFDGYVRTVSGSSYAAARVSALAGCLLAGATGQSVTALKQAIFALATHPRGADQAYTSHGFLPDPDQYARGECAAALVHPVHLPGVLITMSSSEDKYRFAASFWLMTNAGWPVERVEEVMRTAADILTQCDIGLVAGELAVIDGPERYRYFHTRISSQLIAELAPPKPAILFLKDTLQPMAFGAEAIGEANSAGRPALRHTVWMTSHVADPGVSLAHELVHLLLNTGTHSVESDNLMREDSHVGGRRLTPTQCQAMREIGVAQGLLTIEY